jgi:hypothetical protein
MKSCLLSSPFGFLSFYLVRKATTSHACCRLWIGSTHLNMKLYLVRGVIQILEKRSFAMGEDCR